MAWTSPKTWNVGELITASMMNTHIRDNLLALRQPAWTQTFSSGTTSTTSAGFVGLATTTMTNTGRHTLLLFSGSLYGSHPTGAAWDGYIQFALDGGAVNVPHRFGTRNAAADIGISGMVGAVTPSVGGHTYQVLWRRSGAESVWCEGFYFIVAEIL